MIASKTLYDKVGEVWYRSSTKAKSVNITIKPFEPVKVSVPKAISLEQAKTVVKNNMEWIIREVEKMQQVEKNFTQLKPNSFYSFKDVTIELKTSDVSTISVIEEANGYMLVHTPKTDCFTDEQHRELIERVIIPKMKAWCLLNVVPRAKELSYIHKIAIPSISIRKSKTRWGSLGKNDGLNLSLFLATLPKELIDYVILHELAHTKYKNHSKLYWAYLKSLCNDYSSLSEQLKRYRIGII